MAAARWRTRFWKNSSPVLLAVPSIMAQRAGMSSLVIGSGEPLPAALVCRAAAAACASASVECSTLFIEHLQGRASRCKLCGPDAGRQLCLLSPLRPLVLVRLFYPLFGLGNSSAVGVIDELSGILDS